MSKDKVVSMGISKLNQPVKPITKKSATRLPELKEFVSNCLKPAIHQWLNNYPELTDSDKQKISWAICRAYHRGKTDISILKFQLPGAIEKFLSQNAEANRVRPKTFSLEKPLTDWVQQASGDIKQQQARQQARDKILEAYQQKLTYFNLFSLGLSNLSKAIGPLTQLAILELKDNQLTILPESLAQLTQEVSNNRLNNFPEYFKNFTALELVVLTPSVEHTVKTPEVKKEVDLFLQSLQKWKDDYLRIMTPPENLITERKKLVTVIKKVYHAYKNKMENLDLSNLGISTLPDQLTQLTCLKRLDISHNSIYELPENIHLLTNLEILIATNNNLSTLPQGLTKLHHLKSLCVKNNHLFKHINNSYEPHRLDKTRKLIDSLVVKIDIDDQYNLLSYHEKLKTKSMKEKLDLWVIRLLDWRK